MPTNAFECVKASRIHELDAGEVQREFDDAFGPVGCQLTLEPLGRCDVKLSEGRNGQKRRGFGSVIEALWYSLQGELSHDSTSRTCREHRCRLGALH